MESRVAYDANRSRELRTAVKTVVLVEGESDRIVVETLAARRGRDLAVEGCGGGRRRSPTRAHAGIAGC
jgi:hypothetical protein